MGLDIIVLHDTRHDERFRFKQAGFAVHCSGTSGGRGNRKKGQAGVGLSVREKITRALVRPPEFINERLLKVTMKLRGRASAVTFVVVYGPTEPFRDEGKKHAFWAALDGAVIEVPITNRCL